MNRVYFIGAGPGDPKLLTIAGAEALAVCPTVFLFSPYEVTFAALLAGKQLFSPTAFDFEQLCAKVEKLRREGEVAFLVPGDLTFFSPFQPLIDALGEAAQVLPGVGIANAASALLRRTLTVSEACQQVVITTTRQLAEPGSPLLRQLLRPKTTLLLYMNVLPLPELVAELRAGFRGDVPIALLTRIGMPGEEVILSSLDQVGQVVGERDIFQLAANSREKSLTLVIAGRTLTQRVTGDWWSRQHRDVWRSRAEVG